MLDTGRGLASRESPACPPLGQVAQPVGLDRIERDGFTRMWESESAQLPDITVELCVPPDPEGEIVEEIQCVKEKLTPCARLPSPPESVKPFVGIAISQRLNSRRKTIEERPQAVRKGLRPRQISALLQAVGDLSAHDGRKAPKVEAIIVIRALDEEDAVEGRAAVTCPASRVGLAHPAPSLLLQRTSVDGAGWPRAQGRAGGGRRPGHQIGLAVPRPARVMGRAETSVIATPQTVRHFTTSQRQPAWSSRRSRRDPATEGRLASPLPSIFVRMAESIGSHASAAPRDRAGSAGQRCSTGRRQDHFARKIWPELRDHSIQPERFAGRMRRAYESDAHAAPGSRHPAVTRARRASSTSRWLYVSAVVVMEA